MSRCSDHKQNLTVYFCNVLRECVCVIVLHICGCIGSCFAVYLRGRFPVWSNVFSLKLILKLNWMRAEEKSRRRWKLRKAANMQKILPPVLWDNIFLKNIESCFAWLGWVTSRPYSMMSLFPQLEPLSRSLFKHEIRLDEICIRQYHPMTGPSVNVIGKLLAKLMFSHLHCRFVLTTSPWIFHRPYVMVYRGHRAGI